MEVRTAVREVAGEKAEVLPVMTAAAAVMMFRVRTMVNIQELVVCRKRCCLPIDSSLINSGLIEKWAIAKSKGVCRAVSSCVSVYHTRRCKCNQASTKYREEFMRQ